MHRRGGIVMDSIIRDQILEVRDTGKTNMFDTVAVQRIAYEMNLYELVNWIEDNKKEYVNFIMYGDEK